MANEYGEVRVSSAGSETRLRASASSFIGPPIDSPGIRGTQTEFTSSLLRFEMPIAAGRTLSDGAFVSCIKYTHCTPDLSLRCEYDGVNNATLRAAV